ncbi:hypothetical protein IQ264_08535 [Phormidium sp. LEGE 05292]|uniref:hypothetical protein n=1 Tax=[Phormidium] sp. LEGE 05292 TaxID=767427 RepID=UPI00187EA368|nr:hypothetical protein [Phormidium sp. LEGE 05292]MBE9225469.1 hypothetical protein [Phormidium sp. LEGE 05292]
MKSLIPDEEGFYFKYKQNVFSSDYALLSFANISSKKSASINRQSQSEIVKNEKTEIGSRKSWLRIIRFFSNAKFPREEET